MFSYAFTFITLTLLSLVFTAFYLKVPKASIPLIVIYVIFIFNNKESDITNNQIEAVETRSLEVKTNIELEKKPDSSFNGLVTIKPKPITFDSKTFQDRKAKEVKMKAKSDEKITNQLELKKKAANPTLVVKDIKICKKIYK